VGLLAGSAVGGFLLLGGLAMYGADVQPGRAPWLMPTTIGVTVLGTLWLAALGVGLVRSLVNPLKDVLVFSRQIGAGNLRGCDIDTDNTHSETGQLLFAL